MTHRLIATRRGALAFAAGGALLPLAAGRAAFAQATPDEYVPMMLEVGAFTKGAAQIALDKVQDDMARRFAQLEIGEIDAVVAVLTGISGAQPPAPEQLPGTKGELIAQLRDTAAGPEFDRLFVQAEITGHEEGLAIQQPLSDQSEISVPVTTAKLAEESIKSHLAILQGLQASLA